MKRRSFIVGIVMFLGIAVFPVGSASVVAQEEFVTAGHPLVGTWILSEPGAEEGPSLITFTADGIVIDLETNGSSGLGAWKATGTQTAELTLVIVDNNDEFIGTIQINAALEVDSTGNAGTGEYGFTVVLADGTVIYSDSGAFTIVRMPIQPIDATGTAMPELPVWNSVLPVEDAESAATPVS